MPIIQSNVVKTENKHMYNICSYMTVKHIKYNIFKFKHSIQDATEKNAGEQVRAGLYFALDQCLKQ